MFHKIEYLSKFMLITILIYCWALTGTSASPITTTTEAIDEETTTDIPELNGAQDLFVIRSVVYEVGILTEAGNDTDTNTTHEEVDVSFYDPAFNGSVIDLSHIPVPIQANVSGVSVTGLLPADLSALLSQPIKEGAAPVAFNTTIWPTKQIKVTQNISTSDPLKGEEILTNLPKVLGLSSSNSEKKA